MTDQSAYFSERKSRKDARRRVEAKVSQRDVEAAVASGGAVVSERAVAHLQRAAGNEATRSLIQREGGPAAGQAPDKGPGQAGPEEVWAGSIEGPIRDNPAAYHTISNFGDQQLEYQLRIHNEGHTMLSLETQYDMANGERQRAWTAISAGPGETAEVTNGLPPRWTLHLRLFGERDGREPDQYYVKGSAESRRTK